MSHTGEANGCPDRLFLLSRPSREAVVRRLRESADEPASFPFSASFDPEGPPGFVRDERSVMLGSGEAAWVEAKAALKRWRMFEQPWFEIFGAEGPPEPRRTVAILVPVFGLWCLNLSRVAQVFDASQEGVERFGFVYVTLNQHAARGQERFEVRHRRESGEVDFRLEALSRPSRLYLRAGYPLVRRMQRRFAEGALTAMRQAVGAEEKDRA